MVSKRQKLARKKFREEHPELLPKAEPPKEQSKKKKKKKITTKKTKNSSGMSGKHPLRIPGMRPGESCFICKSKDHIAKLCPDKSMWEKNKICLHCRRHGHSLKNCPEKGDTLDKKLCYNCGEVGHSLSRCSLPLQDGGTKFASCFICNERGHLSKYCPKNTHGIYPKGGSCKICDGVTHLAKDCPNKDRRNLSSTELESSLNSSVKHQQGTRIVFQSGDDLEDDFMVDDTKSEKKEVKSHPNTEPTPFTNVTEKNIHAKSKKNEGPKVVNFLG